MRYQWLRIGISALFAVLFLALSFFLEPYRFVWYFLCGISLMVALFQWVGFLPSRPRRITRWTILGISACLLILFCLILGNIVAHHRGDDGIPDTEGIIVLGCQVVGNKPTPILEERLIVALEYMEKHPDSVAVLTGYKGKKGNVSEAEAMRRWLTAHGISEDRLILDENARDTRENINNSLALLRERGINDENVVVVSNGFHLFRAKKLCSWNGCNAYGLAGDMPGGFLFSANWYLREVISVILVYGEQIFA